MKKYFNSNERLEMCDVLVSENGRIEIETKNYHREQLAALGKLDKVIPGRIKMNEANLEFEPYGKQTRKPTYQKQVRVGSCSTLAVTADKLKISMVINRHMGQQRMVEFVSAEMDDILAQLEGELYDLLMASSEGSEDSEHSENSELSEKNKS